MVPSQTQPREKSSPAGVNTGSSTAAYTTPIHHAARQKASTSPSRLASVSSSDLPMPGAWRFCDSTIGSTARRPAATTSSAAP